MDHEFIGGFVQRCDCLKTSHIGAMADLSLSIAAENIEILNLGQPLCFLLSTGQVLDRDPEHGNSQSDSWHQSLEVANPIDVRGSNHTPLEVELLVLLVEDVDSLPEVLLHLMRSHIVEFDEVAKLGIGAESVDMLLPLIGARLTTSKEKPELLLVEGELGSFF